MTWELVAQIAVLMVIFSICASVVIKEWRTSIWRAPEDKS